jgi:hypothetical protein
LIVYLKLQNENNYNTGSHKKACAGCEGCIGVTDDINFNRGLVTTEALTLFIIPDGVNIRGMQKLIQKAFYQMYQRISVTLIRFFGHGTNFYSIITQG